jgi:hypothetical protein
MSVNAKTLVKDRFWIIQENGEKIGTLQKQDNQNWIFLSKKDQREIFETKQSLFDRFGSELFNADIIKQDNVQMTNDSQEYDVHGYPVNQQPYNPMFDVQKQLPIYTKTPKSKSLFCAGYYIICFEKGWRKAYCPKVITLQRYPYKGPIRTKLEMQQVLNNAIKEQNTNPAH